MKILGPERYSLAITPDSYTVTCKKGTSKFSGLATMRKPKLYIIAVDEKPIYAGITKQRLSDRFRIGWKAKGESGYYGYAWRHKHSSATLDIWCHDDATASNGSLDIETIEAEVVFLIRSKTGQWPLHQTEIHFHSSTEQHRTAAQDILAHYNL